MKKYISKFHYLAQDLKGSSHVSQAKMACEAGANWIQYRCMNKDDEELVEEIDSVAQVCDDWGATLIITNHYHLLKDVDAQGVHIEDVAADLAAIRNKIGEDKTLGASANNLQQLLALQAAGVADYCGYGPFAHTDTKPNSKSPLGFYAYRELQKHLIPIPVIAVGGIRITDVDALLATGIYGIAVSAAINLSIDPAGSVKEFYRKMY